MKIWSLAVMLFLAGCTHNATWEVEKFNPKPNPQAGTFKVVYSYWNMPLFSKPVDGNDWDEYWVASRQCKAWGYDNHPYTPNAVRVGPIKKECGYNPNGSSAPGLRRSCSIWYVSSHWRCVI